MASAQSLILTYPAKIILKREIILAVISIIRYGLNIVVQTRDLIIDFSVNLSYLRLHFSVH